MLNQINLVGGLALGAFGVCFLVVALGYDIGALNAMGPGYFPLVLAVTCILLSLYLAISSIRKPVELPPVAWRAFLTSMGSIAIFALTINTLGLIPATIGAVIIAALGDPTSRPLGTIVLAVVLAVSAWLIFTLGLGLPMPAFRGFL